MVEIASRIALHDVLREMVLDARDEGIDVRVWEEEAWGWVIGVTRRPW